VATNFKRHENEVIPQLLKLKKKIECGAKFVIAQIGFDARKSHEMLCYLRASGMSGVPLIGNVFLLTATVARFFRKQTIPGVIISDSLFAECERQAASADGGASWFRELAAKQLAIFRGMGLAGAYLGGSSLRGRFSIRRRGSFICMTAIRLRGLRIRRGWSRCMKRH
jgi:methylenetetrahydrofolate reductase (NADPH)